MSVLCLGTFLKAIKMCKAPQGFVQKILFGDLFNDIYKNYYPNENMIAHFIDGSKNPSNDFIDYITNMDRRKYRELSKCFDKIINRIDSNKKELLTALIVRIIEDDETINSDTVVECTNGISKSQLRKANEDLRDLLSGVFIYIIKNTKNKITKNTPDDVTNDFVLSTQLMMTNPTSTKNDIVYVNDTSIDNEGRRFLVNHSEEKSLIPLCQMALILNPDHRHHRGLYTEFNLLSENARNYVLKKESIAVIETLDSSWVNESMKLLTDELKALNLSSHRFLYLINQYFYKAFKYYANNQIGKYDLNVFVRLYTESHLLGITLSEYSSLDQYIYDYLYFIENNIPVIAEPPLDYLWRIQNFKECDECDLTFWVCRFIVDVCNNIVLESCVDYIEHEEQITTQEDMYYYAMLSLYNFWMNKHCTEKSDDNNL